MNNLSREQMVEQLRHTVCEVKFTKVNGEERVMQCTLKEDVLPPATKNDTITQKRVREVNPEVLAVWDINQEAFRSFRVANVLDFQPV